MTLDVAIDTARCQGVLHRRLLAAVVDHAIIAGLTVVFCIPVFGVGRAFSTSVTFVTGGYILVATVMVAGYFVERETVAGRTVGHRIVGLEVVSVDGTPLTLQQSLIRTVGRMIDFLPVGYLLGVIVALAGDGTRRFGDLQAGTAVVRADPSLDQREDDAKDERDEQADQHAEDLEVEKDGPRPGRR